MEGELDGALGATTAASKGAGTSETLDSESDAGLEGSQQPPTTPREGLSPLEFYRQSEVERFLREANGAQLPVSSPLVDNLGVLSGTTSPPDSGPLSQSAVLPSGASTTHSAACVCMAALVCEAGAGCFRDNTVPCVMRFARTGEG